MEAAVTAGEPAPAPAPREPWIGANLSLCWPGLGDLYAGARAPGWLQVGAGVILVVLGGWFSFAPRWNGAIGLILLVGLVPLALFSIWSAHRACRARSTPEFDQLRRSQRDVWKAVFLSRIFPGLGQLYDRRRLAGALYLIAGILVSPVPGAIGSVLGGTLASVASFDAYVRSRSRPAP